MTIPSQIETKEKLKEILTHWINEELAGWKYQLVCAIHFGSTSGDNIKLETDVDLLLIFKELPDSKWERFEFIKESEKRLEDQLKILNPYQLYPSVLTWKLSSFLKFHTLYLDFVERANILYDQDQTALDIINKTRQWLNEVGAIRYQKGNLWYWDVNPTQQKKFKWGF